MELLHISYCKGRFEQRNIGCILATIKDQFLLQDFDVDQASMWEEEIDLRFGHCDGLYSLKVESS